MDIRHRIYVQALGLWDALQAAYDRYSFGIGIGQYIGIGRYIGFTDKGNVLSVSANTDLTNKGK